MSLHKQFYDSKIVQILFICATFLGLSNGVQARSSKLNRGSLPLIEFSKLEKDKQTKAQSILTASFSADFPNMNCTGTYISNDGVFLTADHCIQSCFRYDDESFEKYIEYESFRGPDLEFGQQQWLSLRRFRDAIITDNVLCDLEVNGEKKQAKLVIAGKGAVHPHSPNSLKDEKLLSKYNEYESKGIGWPSSDFAILQLVDKPKTPCLRLGNRRPIRDEKLKAVSYTCIPTSSADNISGSVPFYTEGIPATPDMFKSLDGKNKYMPGNLRNAFISNIDAETCSSGSAVVGSDGKILGVMSLLKDSSKKWGPLVKLLKISSSIEIIETIQTKLGQDILCER